MAILLNGNYYRISKEDIKAYLSNVKYNIYKDAETRQTWLSEFDIAPQENSQVEITEEFLNSVVTNLYAELKKLEKFNWWIDC